KTVHLPMQHLTNIFHILTMIPYMANRYHHKTGVGEQAINAQIEAYKKLSQEIKDCNGIGNKRWTYLLAQSGGQVDTPPWCPVIMETIREAATNPTVSSNISGQREPVGVRFWVGLNRNVCGDDPQELINHYFKEIRERVSYNSECIFHITDLINNKQPIIINSGALNANPQQRRQQVNAQQAQANAAPPPDATSNMVKMTQLTELHKRDKLKSAEILTTTQIRSWEISNIEAVCNPFND